MPITSSAKKALRASKNKAVYNAKRKDAISDVTKKIKKLVSEQKFRDAERLLPKAFQVIDKAAKTHLIHKNTASRKKSRITALVLKSQPYK